jgi:hypothetical protein
MKCHHRSLSIVGRGRYLPPLDENILRTNPSLRPVLIKIRLRPLGCRSRAGDGVMRVMAHARPMVGSGLAITHFIRFYRVAGLSKMVIGLPFLELIYSVPRVRGVKEALVPFAGRLPESERASGNLMIFVSFGISSHR